MSSLRQDADRIIRESIEAVLPDAAVARALREHEFTDGRIVLVAVGKAAWQMAHAAAEILDGRIDRGIVITKYGHVRGELRGICCMEAGHPVPDLHSFEATRAAIRLVSDLKPTDTVLFLLSGGGSALFEDPLIPPAELEAITNQLLAGGADIIEMNTIRKRMSAVKGGQFARLCAPARVFSIVLSDVVGDALDMIASGPTVPDTSTHTEALAIVKRYGLHLSERARELLTRELPQTLDNAEAVITGSVRELCQAGAAACKKLGYEPMILTERLTSEASEAGRDLAEMAVKKASEGPIALIAGGETVVHLAGASADGASEACHDDAWFQPGMSGATGGFLSAQAKHRDYSARIGKGGRNQELALSAAKAIAGLENVAIFSVGSDGTDGPTDAAGGYVDGYTFAALREKDVDYEEALACHDAYTALSAVGGLVITGPTCTNVNDLAVALISAV